MPAPIQSSKLVKAASQASSPASQAAAAQSANPAKAQARSLNGNAASTEVGQVNLGDFYSQFSRLVGMISDSFVVNFNESQSNGTKARVVAVKKETAQSDKPSLENRPGYEIKQDQTSRPDNEALDKKVEGATSQSPQVKSDREDQQQLKDDSSTGDESQASLQSTTPESEEDLTDPEAAPVESEVELAAGDTEGAELLVRTDMQKVASEASKSVATEVEEEKESPAEQEASYDFGDSTQLDQGKLPSAQQQETAVSEAEIIPDQKPAQTAKLAEAAIDAEQVAPALEQNQPKITAKEGLQTAAIEEALKQDLAGLKSSPITSKEDAAIRTAMQEALMTQLTLRTAALAMALGSQDDARAATRGSAQSAIPNSPQITQIDSNQSVRAERAQREERATQEARSNPQLTRTSVARTLEKVEAALKEVARSHNGRSISVRLDPPDLGSVKVDMTLKDGALHARVTAESQAVTALLRERVYELRSSLRALGLNIEKMNIMIQGDSQQPSASFEQFQQHTADSFQEHYRKKDSTSSWMVPEAQGSVTNQKQVKTITEDHWVA